MNIVIVTNYCQTPAEKGNNRFNYIAEMFANAGHQVEFITSTFSHRRKQQRKREEEGVENLPYKFTMVYEPGYKKNVTPIRFYSHWIFAKNVKKYLENLKEKPDIIYCAIPSLDAAKVTCKYAGKHHIPFVIDIQDLWPEAFEMVFKVPIIKNLLFYTFRKEANYVYQRADEIVAVSQTYADRALKVNKKNAHGLPVFLGTDLAYFDSFKLEEKEKKNTIQLVYIGTLGHSYDITTTIDALKILEQRGIKDVELLVMGDGPLKNKFEEYAKQKKANVKFTGRLSYAEMVPRLCNCDIAINPITRGAAQSIINKVGDYAAAGLPVINTQECKEYRQIVDNYQIGLNCKNDDSEDMANKIFDLYMHKEKRKEMGNNNRKLAEEKFDRRQTYPAINELIKKISAK